MDVAFDKEGRHYYFDEAKGLYCRRINAISCLVDEEVKDEAEKDKKEKSEDRALLAGRQIYVNAEGSLVWYKSPTNHLYVFYAVEENDVKHASSNFSNKNIEKILCLDETRAYIITEDLNVSLVSFNSDTEVISKTWENHLTDIPISVIFYIKYKDFS